MNKLIARFGKAVKGVLTGFDRIVFKGTILPLAHEDGAMSFLRYHIQIALNGREWLRRRLEARHVDFLRQGNKFLHVEDYALAQRFLRQQLDWQWPRLLNRILPTAFPTMPLTLGPHLSYYWTLWQSEWATDLIMDTPAELTATMASLLRHAFRLHRTTSGHGRLSYLFTDNLHWPIQSPPLYAWPATVVVALRLLTSDL